MLLDRCVITTSFRICREVFEDRIAFNKKYGTDILDFSPRSYQKAGREVKSCKLVFGSFQGIELFAEEIASDWWEAKNIHINPRKILYRHNGNGLSVEETLNAFAYLREEISCVLHNPDDIIHILPGLNPRSNAFWSVLEIPVDLYDKEDNLGKVFRNAHYPRMSEGARYGNGNIQIGSRSGPLKISFYRKDEESKGLHRKYDAKEVPPVFRVEVTLSRGKLLEMLGNERNTQMIDDRQRLVRFLPEDLIDCHRGIIEKLQGCYKISSSEQGQKNRLPRFMAMVANRCDVLLTDLFDWYELEICHGQKTNGEHRLVARKALAEMGPLRLSEIFTDEAYQRQPRIEIRNLEKMISDRRMPSPIDPAMREAYGG